MIWHSRKPKAVKVGDTTLHVVPPTASQQLEFLELLDGSVKDPRQLPAVCTWVLSTLVQKIEGLKDEEGAEVDASTLAPQDLVEGCNIGTLHSVIDAVIRMGQLSEDKKKE